MYIKVASPREKWVYKAGLAGKKKSSWKIFHERMLPARSNHHPDHQPEAHPTEPPRPAEPAHDETYNKTTRDQQRLRSGCTSLQSDQSSLSACAFYSLQVIQREKKPMSYILGGWTGWSEFLLIVAKVVMHWLMLTIVLLNKLRCHAHF